MSKTILNAAYSFMDNYAQHAGLSIMSLFDNNRDIDEINVYVIDGGIRETNKQRLENIASDFDRNVIFIDLEEISRKMEISTNFCRSTYGKLFLSQIKDVDRMLAFDCDTIVSGSLKDLLTYNIDDCLVAGVQDTVNPYYVDKAELSIDKRYINCGGVIILNLKLWRALGIEDKCLEYVMQHNGNPPFVDQGTINYICKDKVKVLPPEYNLINPMLMFNVEKIKDLFKLGSYYTQSEIENAKKKPLVIHYTGELFNRPWFKNCTHPYKDVYIDYLRKSPWNGELKNKAFSNNCRIQNFTYHNMPYPIYKLMIRFIEFRHRHTTRIM